MIKNISQKWFTLIEIIVSVSILSIIMVSVFTIFMLSTDLNNKIDISRSLQENIKNIEQIITEDIKLNHITWVNNDIINANCSLSSSVKYSSWTKLCIGTNSYYLAKKNIVWNWSRVSDYNECILWTISCYLVKHTRTEITQLSNSWVDFRNLYFYVSNSKVKKVTIHFQIQPSIHKWIKPDLIKNNTINFETTLSEKLYNN